MPLRAYAKVDHLPMDVAADLGGEAATCAATEPGAEWLNVPVAASFSCARQNQIWPLHRLRWMMCSRSPWRWGRSPSRPPWVLCPLTDRVRVQKAAKMDLEGKNVSGGDGLMGASNKPNIHITVSPDGEDAWVPLPK